MKYFIDFDRTIFDTDAFIAYLNTREDTRNAKGLPEMEYAAVLNRMTEEGALSFLDGELQQFVYSDVTEFLRTAGDELTVITYGNPAFQKLKISNALSNMPHVSVIYTGDTHKGEWLKKNTDVCAEQFLLVDDKLFELESAAQFFPNATLYEMRRDKRDGDGRWPVVTSLLDLPL